jgi:hypothetical protein
MSYDGLDCRARLPGKTAGQDCRARLPGKTAGQDCRARLPGKTAGQEEKLIFFDFFEKVSFFTVFVLRMSLMCSTTWKKSPSLKNLLEYKCPFVLYSLKKTFKKISFFEKSFLKFFFLKKVAHFPRVLPALLPL